MSEIRKVIKLGRIGHNLCLKEYEVEYFDKEAARILNSKILWKFNLYIFIQVPFVLLFVALLILRFKVCMEVFNNFWYCVLR